MALAGSLHKTVRSWPIIAGTASLIALAVTFGYNLWGGYHAEIAATKRTGENLSQVLEKHTETTFDAVNGILQATIRHLRLLRQLNATDPASIRDVLAAGTDSLRQINALVLYDENGVAANAGILTIPLGLTVEGRRFFQSHRDDPAAGALVSEVFRSGVSPDMVLSVSRRIDHPDGSFAGVLSAEVPIEALTNTLYRALSVGPHGAVTLVRTDGHILAREPAPPGDLTTARITGRGFDPTLVHGKFGSYVGKSSVDGIERILTSRRLQAFPLIVGVSIAVDDALADWYAQVFEFSVIWLICAIVMSIVTLLAARHASRIEAAETEAREARTILSDALEGIDGGILVYDAEGRFVLMNRYMAETSPRSFVERAVPGATYEDLTWALAESGEIVEAKDREAEWVRERLERHRRESHWREERKLSDGTWRQISERVTSSGGVAILVSDTTFVKKAEAALQLSEDRFHRLAANIPGYVFQRHVTNDGVSRITYVSGGARDFYGCDPQELIDNPSLVGQALHPDDYAQVDAGRLVALKTLCPWQADFRLISRDGTVRWVSSQARPARLGDGSVLWDGVVVDITARKQAEAALTEAKVKAERATRAKSSFLASMSHELRTPLNAILGFSEALATISLAPKLAHKSVEYAGDIHSAGSHLLQLINDLLDLSKAEAGKMELSESEVDVTSIVTRVKRLLAARASESGIALKTSAAPDLPMLRGDERKILQIMINLVANAIRFTPRGGSVAASASRSADGGIQIVVADTGIGIAAENLPSVLIPFAQIDNEITRHTIGTGLGLPIAKQFVDLHGGSLTIESERDQGTTVTVILPPSRVIGRQGSEVRLAAGD